MGRTRAAPRSRWPMFDGALGRAHRKTKPTEIRCAAPRFDTGRFHNTMNACFQRTRRCPASGALLRIAVAETV